MKHCNKKMKVEVMTIDGQTFFEKAEVRCGWWRSNDKKWQCEKCKKKLKE